MEHKIQDKKQSEYFENKITIVSFVLSIFVIYIHANCLKDYGLQDNTSSISYWIVKIITSGIGGVAVPIFFIISGYLYFRNIDLSTNINLEIRRKQKSRIKSILIPYLIWNLFGTLFYMFIPRIPLVDSIMNGTYVDMSFGNILRGILVHEYYFPLWYLKDLIILICLARVIANILKSKTISNIVVSILGIFVIFEIKFMYLNISSIYFYFIGCYFAIYMREFFEKKKCKNTILRAAIIFFILAFIRIALDIEILVKLSYIISPIVAWILMDLIVEYIKINWFIKQSFFIYCSHIIIVTTINKILLKMGNGREIWVTVTFLSTPIITLLIIYLIARFMNIYLKDLYKVICGSRG